MAYRHCRLGYLVRFEPTRAKVRLLKAFSRCGGNMTRTASALGVDRRTLMRWATLLDLRSAIAELREAAAA